MHFVALTLAIMKKEIFSSHKHPRTCPHCHLPKIKRRLNLNNFTRVHRAAGPGAGGPGNITKR